MLASIWSGPSPVVVLARAPVSESPRESPHEPESDSAARAPAARIRRTAALMRLADLWARLVSNQRPLACEAWPRISAHATVEPNFA